MNRSPIYLFPFFPHSAEFCVVQACPELSVTESGVELFIFYQYWDYRHMLAYQAKSSLFYSPKSRREMTCVCVCVCSHESTLNYMCMHICKCEYVYAC